MLLQGEDENKIIFHQSSKLSLAEGQSLVQERAKYIGVSLNGKNWQSLIVIENLKVYLGTYKTQEEAAVMFDFHTILVKSLKAKVNSNYTVKDVLLMIKNFNENGNEFNVSKFISN